jgi:hypothetical protein
VKSSGQNALRKAKDFIAAQGGEVAPLSISEEELNPDAQDDLTLQASPLESTNSVYEVPYDCSKDTNCSEFRFFEDGRQRTIQIGYIRVTYPDNLVLIPVHFFVVAAVVLERIDRKLSLWRGPLIKQGIFVAKSLVPNQAVLDEFEQAGLAVIDTESSELGVPSDYYDMRRRALRRAKDLRLSVEQELISQWRSDGASAHNFLVVDGTLMNMRDERNVESCIGVSKSFGSRYFDISKHNAIMQMKACQRSWTFRFHDPEEDLRKGVRERASWYLRLRDRRRADPEFGLIRVEISKTYIKQAPELATRFSRSLLSERLPTAYPAPRWDKHLYPIRGCENYLSSVMPSIPTIAAAMQG